MGMKGRLAYGEYLDGEQDLCEKLRHADQPKLRRSMPLVRGKAKDRTWRLARKAGTPQNPPMVCSRRATTKEETMKHTPGPLTVHPQGDACGIYDGEKLIGDAYGRAPAPWELPTYPAQANAQLWAAAPELLEACKAALVELEGLDATFEGLDESTYESLFILRAAIAKAEGTT